MSVVDFGTSSLVPALGERLDTEAFFLAYEKSAQESRLRALAPEPFKRLCNKAGIQTSKRNGRLYLLNVKLAEPLRAAAE